MMNIRKILLLGVFFSVGVAAGYFWFANQAQPTQNVACRPSVPQLLSDGPKVLFWGNSIAFDHGWDIPGLSVVNCAVQGLTARQALLLTEKLPEIEFDAIVVVFGSVELVRDQVEVEEFGASIEGVIKDLRSRYEGSDIIALGVPENKSKDRIWLYPGGRNATTVNARLTSLENVDFLNTTALLDNVPDSQRTYDGVHLTKQSYLVVETSLAKLLAQKAAIR